MADIKETARRAGQTYATGGFNELDKRYGIAQKINPFDTRKSNEISKAAERNAGEQYEKSQPILGRMNDADTAYQGSYGNASKDYKAERDTSISSYLANSGRLRQEASDQGTNAQTTYTNDIQPRLKANMESAMTLQEAGDPNNKVQTAVRGMYDKRGQQARQQGQQDYGVLSALGAQAAGQQFGASGPMTSGMQGQIYAANQGQAGDAYARAQQRMYDLEQQGIDRGFDESSKQYDRGRNATQDFMGAEGEYLNRGRDSRNERNAYDADSFGVKMGRAGENMDLDMGYAGLGRDAAYSRGERELGSLGQYYGTQQSILGNKAEEEAARRAGQVQAYGGLAQAGAKAYGAA